MSDEIIPTEFNSAEPPAVAEISEDPHDGNVPWTELTDSQKLDILHMKVDSIGQQVSWIGSTFQGVLNMVGNLSPMDLFKMVRGGK